MAAPKARNAYEVLLQAIQQQNQQRQSSDSTLSSIPDDSSSGSLLGKFLTAQAVRNQWQAAADYNDPIPSEVKDPNFRHLARLVPPQTIVAPSIVPDSPDTLGMAAAGSTLGSGSAQYAMGRRKPTMSECVDRCLHLLPSPSGDLQSMEYHQCITKCMAGEL